MGGMTIQWIHNSEQEKNFEMLNRTTTAKKKEKGKEKGGVVWKSLTKTTKFVSALVRVLEDRLRFPY